MPETTLLFSEILDLVHKAKTKDKKVEILKKYNSDALRMVIKSSFDPNIVWAMPKGNVPYTPNDAPAGTEHTRLATESRKLFHFIQLVCALNCKWFNFLKEHWLVDPMSYVAHLTVLI